MYAQWTWLHAICIIFDFSCSCLILKKLVFLPKILRDKQVFGTVVGGFNETLREISAKQTAGRHVAGTFVI